MTAGSTTSTISHVGFSTSGGKGDLNHLEASIARIVELGGDVAELALCSEDIITGGRIVPKRAERLADICGKFPISYTVHGLIVSNFMDVRHLDFQMAAAMAMVDLCGMVGSKVLVHHAGHTPLAPRRVLAQREAMQRDALLRLADYAGNKGVAVALENIFAMDDSEHRQSPSDVAETIRSIAHPYLVGTIDFSHAYIETTRTGMDFLAEVEAMGPVAGHLHVHDSFGRPYTMTKFYQPSEAVALGIGDLHLPLGWGDIPWEMVFDRITPRLGTALILEIDERFDADRDESLAIARTLAERLNRRQAMAA